MFHLATGKKEMTPQNTPQGLQDGVELSPLPSRPYEFTDRLISRQDVHIIPQPIDERQGRKNGNSQQMAIRQRVLNMNDYYGETP